jgi:hypothetical protein
MRITRWLAAFRQDLVFASRQLRRSPSFTLVAALTLALGIGANSAIFALVDATLLRPLPVPDADRLVMLWERNPRPFVDQCRRSTLSTGAIGVVHSRRWREPVPALAGW